MNSFKDLALSEPVAKAIDELGFSKPSEIQAQALPILLGEATDFIGLAATGTGKTAAFGIPLLEKIDGSKKRVQGLVMCPTRELALQVTGQINLLGKYKGIKAVPIYGGAGYSDQIHGLRSGNQIVVGTPGRIIDHIERGTLQFQDLTTIVLDEADEMISMGFKEDIETILKSATREQCRIWLFSATMSPEVRRVAATYLKSPQQVQVNSKVMLSDTVQQLFYPTRESDKPEVLCKLIDAAEEFYGIIFCQTKALVMDLSQYMAGRGYKVDSLHGDKSQSERERTMKAFRDRKVSILICTDVASRGLDVKDVSHVVNYSIPRELDVYVHRIGRTARVGKSGVAMSLVTPSHRGLIGRIEYMTKSRMTEGKIPTRKDIGAKKISKVLAKFQEQEGYLRAVELLGSEWQAAIENMRGEEIAGRFMTMMFADVFEQQERTKPLQAVVPTDARGNALPNGGRNSRERFEPRDRREPRERRESSRDHREGSRDRYESREPRERRGPPRERSAWSERRGSSASAPVERRSPSDSSERRAPAAPAPRERVEESRAPRAERPTRAAAATTTGRPKWVAPQKDARRGNRHIASEAGAAVLNRRARRAALQRVVTSDDSGGDETPSPRQVKAKPSSERGSQTNPHWKKKSQARGERAEW